MRRKYDYALFDLDGTITESSPGIRKGIEYALEKVGAKPVDLSDTSIYIGPPLMQTFTGICGLSEEDAITAYGYYSEYYDEKGIFENIMYTGIGEIAKELITAGAQIAVCTSKFEPFGKKVIEILKLDELFTIVCGSVKQTERQDKEITIPYTMRTCGAEDKSKVVMIGDTKFDAKGARVCGVDFVGVLYGYGTREQLEAEGCDKFAETVYDLRKFLFEE